LNQMTFGQHTCLTDDMTLTALSGATLSDRTVHAACRPSQRSGDGRQRWRLAVHRRVVTAISGPMQSQKTAHLRSRDGPRLSVHGAQEQLSRRDCEHQRLQSMTAMRAHRLQSSAIEVRSGPGRVEQPSPTGALSPNQRGRTVTRRISSWTVGPLCALRLQGDLNTSLL